MDYFLTINIGPVQDFIASARRCRDLWFGSWLLSELSKAAALALAGPEMIFPPPGQDLSPGSDLNVANKIVTITPDPESAAQKAESAARDRLQEIATNALNAVRGSIELDRANAQIVDLLEIAWAAWPLKSSSEDDFIEARRGAERLLAARKNLREFTQPTWADAVPKSSLDGQRESVIHETQYNALSPQQLYDVYGVRRGERLCGVGLLKRYGERKGRENDDQGGRVFSTSHVAAQGLLNRWDISTENEAAARAVVHQFKHDLEGAPKNAFARVPGEPHRIFGLLDGHLLFENRLDEFFDTSNKASSDEAKAKARSALKVLLEALGGERPHPYYVVLVGDGDKMGSSISAARSRQQNRDISTYLASFAGAVRPLVESHQGSLVYAGGDDVLALLPAHSALSCARALADLFAGIMRPAVEDKSVAPTLSVGLAVVHHLEPLSEALHLARQAEKAAKAIPGKNALAVTLAKRSGSDTTVASQWSNPADPLRGLDARLEKFIGWAHGKKLAAGLAYQWRDLALRLDAVQLPGEDDDAFAKRQAAVRGILRSEAIRLLERKRDVPGDAAVDQAIKDDLRAMMQGDFSLLDLANELILAREFARAQAVAGMASRASSGKDAA